VTVLAVPSARRSGTVASSPDRAGVAQLALVPDPSKLAAKARWLVACWYAAENCW